MWILATGALLAQTVEGHVVSAVSGAGIPGVTVLLQSDGNPVYRATTDSEGWFRIDAVKDGDYTASYMDGVPLPRNFWPVPSPWDGNGQPSPFRMTRGTGRVHLDVKMQPIGKLAGRVLDPSGRPVPDADVWLISGDSGCKLPSCFSFSEQSKTNEKGEYSVTDLRVPGPWRVSATAPLSWTPPASRDDERLGWAQTFYPGVTDPQLAGEIMVRPGGDLWNLDIKLAAVPVHRISGVLLDLNGNPTPKAIVGLSEGFGPVLRQETKSDGSFEFASVAVTHWRMSAWVTKDGVKLWAAQWLSVKDDDLSNVKLRLTAPFSIHGKAVVEVPDGVPAPKLPTIRIALASGDGLSSDPSGKNYQTSDTDGKGEFTIDDVFPGMYQIEAMTDSPTAPYYLDSIRLGDREAIESDVPVLSDAQPVTFIYKLDGGTVRGNIETCGAARVLLVPQDPARRRRNFILSTSCSRTGGFEFSGVRPGEYYGIAIISASPTRGYGGMLDDGVLKEASRVSVRSNESTAADIRLVTRQVSCGAHVKNMRLWTCHEVDLGLSLLVLPNGAICELLGRWLTHVADICRAKRARNTATNCSTDSPLTLY
jgi:Carboxypeptidase regulatory-like domain